MSKNKKMFKNDKSVDLGELWIDKCAAEDLEDGRIPEKYLKHVKDFHKNGFTIFKQAVDPNTIDNIISDMNVYETYPEKIVMKNKGKYIDPTGVTNLKRGDRIVDLYGFSSHARKAIANEMVSGFLNLIFDEAPIAMQSISFQYGSQQAIHQDTAYVISDKPLSLAASWLALEDIQLGSGELIYYPGSHKFDHFFFEDQRKGWRPAVDGQEAHQAFLNSLHEQAKSRQINQEAFLAQKGDVLVWHADLAHGGAKIKDPSVTRKSLVTHFTPKSVKARYKQHIENIYFEYSYANNMLFSSRHYDLRKITESKEGSIIYDGGVTKKRMQSRQD